MFALLVVVVGGAAILDRATSPFHQEAAVQNAIVTPTNTNRNSGVILPAAEIASIEVINTSGIHAAGENVIIHFSAKAALVDGTIQDVTSLVSWKVAGPIGALIEPGVLQTRLPIGTDEAAGTVRASWHNSLGQEVTGESAPITIAK